MFKKIFTEKIEERIKKQPNIKILELGCGDVKNITWLIKKYPEMTYVGIEPGKEAAERAKKALESFKNAEIVNSPAYDTSSKYNGFDLCYSLSVLEHVKNLDLFLKNSIASIKVGGELIHRYDLGHVLQPSSVKEKIQAQLSKYFVNLLPEDKVIRYIDLKWLTEFLDANGIEVNNTSYHQMNGHKSFLKKFETDTPEKEALAREIVEWEYKVSPHLGELKQLDKEKMFPSVNVSGIRKK